MLVSSHVKYLLISVAFSQNPAGIELKKVYEYSNFSDCNTVAQMHNKLVSDTDINERLACMPDTKVK